MRKWGRRLMFAIQFMTRYPVPFALHLQADDFPRMAVFFPIVGVLVGLFAVAMALLGSLASSNIVTAVFAVMGTVVITGAFHLDGLGDTFDAISGKKDRVQMLEVMKDSHVGRWGKAVLAVDLILRVTIVFSLLEGVEFLNVMRMLVVVPVVGRLGIAGGATISQSAKTNGIGRPFIDDMNFFDLLRAAILAFALIAVLFGVCLAALACLLGIVVGMVTAAIMSVSLKGLTGDSLGCLNELSELTCLFLLLFFNM